MNDVLDTDKLAQLQAVLAHWDIPPVTSIAVVDEGRPVYKVTTAGPAFILKDIAVAPDPARLEFTRDVLVHVAREGIHVPLPLPSRSAHLVVSLEDRFYLLSEYIEAGGYPGEPELQAELFSNTGQAIARLHQALASYSDREAGHKTWREDLATYVGEWIAALNDGLPASQAAVVRRVGVQRGAAIEAALRGLPEHLIHRDCHPGNILVQGTCVVGFVDCDHFCIGPRIFDLAYFAVHHLKWVTDDEAATQRWLSNLPHLLTGYNSQQRLSHEEVAALPYGMMAYHLLLAYFFMGSAHHDAIAPEVRSLDWIHTHFDAIAASIASS